jgi:hypothetical protein
MVEALSLLSAELDDDGEDLHMEDELCLGFTLN